ncbi:hypothetical protein Ancab_033173, partial [Ancistrocladus abbreviatus]
ESCFSLGKFIRTDASTRSRSRFDCARILISTSCPDHTSQSVNLVVGDKQFLLRVIEEFGFSAPLHEANSDGDSGNFQLDSYVAEPPNGKGTDNPDGKKSAMIAGNSGVKQAESSAVMKSAVDKTQARDKPMGVEREPSTDKQAISINEERRRTRKIQRSGNSKVVNESPARRMRET